MKNYDTKERERTQNKRLTQTSSTLGGADGSLFVFAKPMACIDFEKLAPTNLCPDEEDGDAVDVPMDFEWQRAGEVTLRSAVMPGTRCRTWQGDRSSACLKHKIVPVLRSTVYRGFQTNTNPNPIEGRRLDDL
jgi:hypothetical protein